MPLYGTLVAMPLPDLLRWLASSSQTGTLQLELNRVRKWIVLKNGDISACATDDPPGRLGQFLLSRGKVTEDQLRNALALQEASSTPLGSVFVEMGALLASDLDALLEAQAEETLFSVFDMAGAAFRFQEGAVDQPGAFRINRTVEDVLERGILRRQEFQRLRETLDDPTVVLSCTKVRPPDSILGNSTARIVYDAIDGRRTIEEILLHVHGSEYLVTKFLVELERAGFVEALPPKVRTEPELVAAAPVAASRAKSTTELGAASALPAPASPHGVTESAVHSVAPPATIGIDPDGATFVDAPAHVDAQDPDADDTLDIPEEFQQSSDLEAVESSVAFQVERQLETARRLLKAEEYEPALEALDKLYRAFPDDDSLRRLISEAEAAFRDKAYRHYLPPHKIPVLNTPLGELETHLLSPSEYFLLSRIDGTWNLKSIIQIAPLREVEALLALKKMRENGLITLKDPPE